MSDSKSTISYLHGLSGDPYGPKRQKLASEYGPDRVHAPHLRFEESALSEEDSDDWRREADRLFGAFANGVEVAQRVFDAILPDVVVGSSFGGGVTLQMDVGDAALVLIAPCWRHPTLQHVTQLYLGQRFPSVVGLSAAVISQAVTPFVPRIDPVVGSATLILHSPQDELIPFGDSREIVERNSLTPDRLMEVGASHGMSDEQALDALLAAVRRQLDDRQR